MFVSSGGMTAKLKGHIIIGGLFPVHKKSKTSEDECAKYNAFTGY